LHQTQNPRYNYHMKIPETIKTNEPATEDIILNTASELGIILPEDLNNFYKKSNGAEGTLGTQGYIQIWPIDTLSERNKKMETTSNLPESIIFASNGGSFNYGYSAERGNEHYFMVDPISMKDDIFEGGKTLEELFARIGDGVLERMNLE